MSTAGASSSHPVPLLLLLLCAAGHVPVALSLKCYVCVPQNDTNTVDVLHIFPKFPANLTCEGFTNNNYRYIRECPSNNTGCIRITDGLKVTRTCSDLEVSDCKMANNVEYCYCNNSLCNGALTARRPFPTTTPVSLQSDDEDLEGSGGGPVDSRKRLITTAPPTATTTRSAPKSVASLCHVSVLRTVFLVLLTASTSLWAH